MMKKLRKAALTLSFLVISWLLTGINYPSALRAEAPLFDSIDENLNPVSMTDMIDGRPLVLAVSSCS